MERTASLSSCGMCETPDDMKCSDEMSSSDELVITQTPHKCCEVKVATIIGTDEYLLAQIEPTIKLVQMDMIPLTIQLDGYSTDFFPCFFSDSSPPTDTSPELFLSNHNFRI